MALQRAQLGARRRMIRLIAATLAALPLLWLLPVPEMDGAVAGLLVTATSSYIFALGFGARVLLRALQPRLFRL